MADKSTSLIFEALRRAAAEPSGVPLYGSKSRPGLFASSAAAKMLAQRCMDEGLLQVVRTEPRGKKTEEICALSEQGIALLLKEVSPREVLASLVQGLEARQGQVTDLLSAVHQVQTSLESLKCIAEKALNHVLHPATTNGVATNGKSNSPELLAGNILNHLRSWRNAGNLEDCPMPELHRAAQQGVPSLSIGQFHDTLRRLHAQHQVYLHPWTGPLYELPEPALALLIGHVVAYYASLR
jgi:hypothetical protein